MARLWSSGFELNTTSANVELTAATGTPPSIQTTTVRSGTYALEIVNSGSVNTIRYDFKASDTQDGFFIRAYFRVASFSAATAEILVVEDSGGNDKISVRLTSGGVLQFFNDEDAAQIGSDSSAISTDTWYRIEVKIDTTTLASTAVELLLDGDSLASGTISLANGINRVVFGRNSATSGSFFYEDIAINDDSGSFQNSFPGAGEVIHLRPNANGDTVDWNDDQPGDAYTAVDEVTPDGGSSEITNSSTATAEFNLDATPAALASDDTINCVQVGWNFWVNSTVGTQPQVVLRIKASSGGTVEESSAILLNTTAANTNATAVPRNYQLTLYDLPGASTTAWTKTDLDAAQIGVRNTVDPSGIVFVTTLWLLVDHTPAVAGGGVFVSSQFMTTNTRFF